MRPEQPAYWNEWLAIEELSRLAQLEQYWRENAPSGEKFDADKARKLRLRNENRAYWVWRHGLDLTGKTVKSTG